MTLSFKNLYRFPSFLLLVEINPLEFYLKPCLKSTEAGERLGTRQCHIKVVKYWEGGLRALISFHKGCG